jgi:hypothetical protein
MSEVREDYAEQWAITQTELMEKLHVIPPGVLKAESDIMDHWTRIKCQLINNDHTIKQRLCCLEQGIINTDQAMYLIYPIVNNYP